MQTIDRPTDSQKDSQKRPAWLAPVVALGSVAFLALAIFAIMNKWGVLLLTITLALAGLGIWTWQKGFRAIEIVAFLIHFDGLEFSIISVGRISAAVLTLVIFHKLFVQRWRPPAVQWKNWYPIWLMLSWVTISGLWSQRAGGFIKAFLMLYLALVFFAVTSMLVESHKDVQRFLRAFWVGGLFGSASGILALFLGTRSEGLIGDPNFFGLVQAAMIPLTVYYLRHATGKWERWFYTVTLAVVLAGAAGAGSRSGLIGASIAIVATMVGKPGMSFEKRARTLGVALLITPIAFAVGFVANPANLQRGFSDRGAGRLDFWKVTIELISERPILGQGFGQLYGEIPQRLLVTQGVKLLDEKRESVSSHNTWLDMFGDAGIVGVSLFGLCFVMAIWTLLRPRWPYMSDLSNTVLTMLLPVLSSSLFLGLLNNKLAWSILGLAAALSIPSESSRWSGLTGDARDPEDGSPPGTALERYGSDPKTPSGGSEFDSPPLLAGANQKGSSLVQSDSFGSALSVPVRVQTVLANPMTIDEMPEMQLAKWDLRFTRKKLLVTIGVAVMSAVVVFGYSSSMPARYKASTGFVAPELDVSSPTEIFRLPVERSQKALALVRSDAYALNLKQLSGIDLTVEEIANRITAEKPEMGGLVTVTFTDSDNVTVEKAAPYLLAALNKVYADAREFGKSGVNDQARPINPGEQNFYDGPPLIAAFSEPVIDVVKAKVMWMTIIGAFSGGLIAIGLYLSGCRRPRVISSDDLVAHTGTPVITHISESMKEPVSSAVAQAQQLRVTIDETRSGAGALRRVLVAPPERSESARRLTINLAAAAAAAGERVVIIDADVRRPWMSLRLDPELRRAGADAPIELLNVNRWSLPRAAKALLQDGTESLRLVSGSQFYDRVSDVIDSARLTEFDEGVTVVILAPPATSATGVSELVEWAQAVVIPVRNGLTTTEDTQLATGRVNLFGSFNSGIVFVNS